MRKAAAFDFDGTMVDTEVHWMKLTQNIFGELTQREWTEDDHRVLVGNSMHVSHQILTEQYGVRIELEPYISMVLERSIPIYEVHAQLNPGALDLVQRMEALDIRKAIASGGQFHRIQSTARRLMIDRYFDVISSGDRVRKNKPHGGVYRKAAFDLKVCPKDIVSFEDSAIGIQSAKEAGTYCVAYRTHQNRGQDLSAADLHIDHFDELTDERLQQLFS